MSENHDNMIDESILSGRLFGAIPALLDNLPAGFAIMQVLLDEDNNPYDFVYKYANNVYAYLVDVSLDDLMKWTWGHLFPDADELLGAFANIALNGGSRVIEDLDHSRKKKTQIICYQPVYGYCAYVMQELDISDAVDVPVEEPSKPEMPAPDAPSAATQTPQPEVQLEAQTAPDSRAEIPPMAALHEEAQMLPFEEPQQEIPPMAALQATEAEPVETEMPQAEVKPVEVEVSQPEEKTAEAEMPQAEVKPVEVEVPQAEVKPVEVEMPQAEMKPVEAEVSQPEVKPVEVEIEAPQPEAQPSEELTVFADADADVEEAADDVQMIEVEITETEEAVEMFEPIAPAETAAAFTAVDESAEPVTVEQDIEKGLASLERLGDVPAEEQPVQSQEETSDGGSVSIMDILENSKNQGTAQEEAADVQGDTYGAPGQNVSIGDIAAAAAQQSGEPAGQPQEAPQAEMPQPAQAQPQTETPQAQPQQTEAPAPQPESAGEPGNINLEVPEEKSFGGHIAGVISDLNHLDDFSAIMKLEDLMQSAQPQQADSVVKAKQMIECSMFEEAKDLLRTLL